MITYNHAKYIEQAVKSVLNQKGDFVLELVIGVDLSDDSTFTICKNLKKESETQNRKIKILGTENRLGMSENLQRTLQICKGKYIAFLEGDDYWTLDSKLSIQKKLLDNNKKIDICATLFSTFIVNENKKIEPDVIKYGRISTISFDYSCVKNPFGTLTVMIRNNNILIPEWVWNMPFIDWPLFCSILSKRKFGYVINIDTATYRFHSKGVYGRQKSKDIIHKTNKIYRHFKREYKAVLKRKTVKLINDRLIKNKKQFFYFANRTKGNKLKLFFIFVALLIELLLKCRYKESRNLIGYYFFHNISES